MFNFSRMKRTRIGNDRGAQITYDIDDKESYFKSPFIWFDWSLLRKNTTTRSDTELSLLPGFDGFCPSTSPTMFDRWHSNLNKQAARDLEINADEEVFYDGDWWPRNAKLGGDQWLWDDELMRFKVPEWQGSDELQLIDLKPAQESAGADSKPARQESQAAYYKRCRDEVEALRKSVLAAREEEARAEQARAEAADGRQRRAAEDRQRQENRSGGKMKNKKSKAKKKKKNPLSEGANLRDCCAVVLKIVVFA